MKETDNTCCDLITVTEEQCDEKGLSEAGGDAEPEDDDKPGWKASLYAFCLCVYGALGGILFGYDTGYINGIMAMPYFENMYL